MYLLFHIHHFQRHYQGHLLHLQLLLHHHRLHHNQEMQVVFDLHHHYLVHKFLFLQCYNYYLQHHLQNHLDDLLKDYLHHLHLQWLFDKKQLLEFHHYLEVKGKVFLFLQLQLL
jgi:hypothetical protein